MESPMNALYVIIFLMVVFGFAFFFLTYFVFVKVFTLYERICLVQKTADYQATLTFFAERAFNIIYKDRVLVFSLEGMKLSNEELRVIVADFVNLVKKLMGKRLVRTFVHYYGGMDTFYKNLVEYFYDAYEKDEIRESIQNSLMNSELPEEPKNA